MTTRVLIKDGSFGRSYAYVGDSNKHIAVDRDFEKLQGKIDAHFDKHGLGKYYLDFYDFDPASLEEDSYDYYWG